MRLTTFTDYCLRALTFVAVKGDELSTIDEIAERYRINRNHLKEVVFRLSQLGYFHTLRGKGGGIRLARDPAKINLGKLIRQTEVDFVLAECFQEQGCLCVIEPACVLKKALRAALGAFFEVLDGYTLADLVKPSQNLARLLSAPAA
ncbi:MAG TPA: Rrf2 family transcriptional regulator [Xanthobacteraceae bacterium]|nr:Rrf2 family transcriptional regulator [Xanthobacteraceae bacterium]